jgi:nucleoside-diphosphate-sugar epimerase
MQNVTLVTGARGFLGRAVCKAALAQGEPVRAFCRQADAELTALGAEVVLGDLRDGEAVATACRGVACVHHVAGLAGIWGRWQKYYEVNTLATEQLLVASRAAGVDRFVYTSSPSVTFDGSEQRGIDESAPYASRWLCHYPHSKAIAEAAVLAEDQNQMRTCALRPHLIWGPGDRHLVGRLVDRSRQGRLRRVGDGTNRIDMLYVDNAADAHLQAAAALDPGARVCGKAYFISQGEAVNCWEWIDQLLAVAGQPPVKRSISCRRAWQIGWGCEAVYRTLGISREPPMTRFLAAQLGRSHYFDIQSAYRDFGYRPRISTEEGMRRLAAAFAEQRP